MRREESRRIEANGLGVSDATVESALRSNGKPQTAIVVDVDESWVESVERLLDRLGIRTVGSTGSAADALDLVDECTPDVLIAGVGTATAEDVGTACLRDARERFPTLTTIGLPSSTRLAPLELPETGATNGGRPTALEEADLDEADLDEADLDEELQGSATTNGRASRSSHPTVSVVIPTLNEAENLPLVLPRLGPNIDEVIIVDGRSQDGTLEVARRLYPNIRAITQAGSGKGDALRLGFEAATGDIIVMLDADGSTDPAEIPAFVGALLSGADFAKGSRFIQGAGTADMTLHRRFGNWAFVRLVRMLFGGRYSDLCYGYNAFWKDALPSLDLGCQGFEIETAMNIRALRARLKIVEVASFEKHRIHGFSKLRTIPDGWRVLKTILRERFTSRQPVEAAEPAAEGALVSRPELRL